MATNSDSLGTTKGFYLIDHVEKVRRVKGEEGVKKLKELVKDVDIDHFSKIKDYPIEDEIKLFKAAAKIIFGKEDENAWLNFGKMDFNTTMQSSLGRVIMALFAKDPKQLAVNLPKVFGFFMSGPKLSCLEATDEKIVMRVDNNPYPKEYYQGMFMAGLEYLGYKSKIEIKIPEPHINEYVIYFVKKNNG